MVTVLLCGLLSGEHHHRTAMTTLLLLAAVVLRLQLGDLRPYEATLQQIRQLFPGTEVVLSTRLFGTPAEEGVATDVHSFPAGWLAGITRKRLIERTCTPRATEIGCASPSPTGRSAIVVLMGPLYRKENRSTLTTWIIAPSPRNRPDWASIQRYTYTLVCVNGHWQIESAVLDAVS